MITNAYAEWFSVSNTAYNPTATETKPVEGGFLWSPLFLSKRN